MWFPWFACRGNAGTENIYNGYRTNAAAEASYDNAVFSCLVVRAPIAATSHKYLMCYLKTLPLQRTRYEVQYVAIAFSEIPSKGLSWSTYFQSILPCIQMHCVKKNCVKKACAKTHRAKMAYAESGNCMPKLEVQSQRICVLLHRWNTDTRIGRTFNKHHHHHHHHHHTVTR